MKKNLEKIVKNLSAFRSFLSGTYAEYGIVLIFFTVLSIILTNYVAFHISSQLFTVGPGDATAGFLWLNFADPGLNPFLSKTTLVSYPFGEQLGSATFITYVALWLPIRIASYLFGPIAGINIIMFCGLISGAMAGYWLLKRLTGSIAVALFSGIAIAFVPYNLYNSSSHIAYIFTIVFVFILASFMALWIRPTKLRAVVFGASIALAFYTDGYYLLLATVMVVGLVVAGVMYAIFRKFSWTEYRKRIATGLLAFIALLVLCIPIFIVQLSQGADIKNTLGSARGDIAGELVAYQSKVMDFILPSPTNPLFESTGQSKVIDDYKNLRSNITESMTYIGFTIIILVAIGIVLSFVRLVWSKYSSLQKIEPHIVNRYLLLTCIVVITTPLFLSFMMSPSTVIAGHVIYLPGQFLIDHNIALWRVLARFFIPMHVILAVYAAFTLWVLLKIHKGVWKNKIIQFSIVAVVSLVLLAEFSTDINKPSFDYDNAPESYRWLSEQDDIKTIAEFPLLDPLDAHTTRYVTYQVVHGKNLVNSKEPSDKRLTNVLGSIDNPEAIDFAYQRGAQAILTHDIECYKNVSWGVLVHSSKDAPSGTICVYRLIAPATNDQSFAVYGDGFKYYPNQPLDVLPFASFEKLQASLLITDKSLDTKAKGRALLSAQINDFQNNRINGRWLVQQDGVTVAEGEIVDSMASIKATIDTSKKVTFKLQPSTNGVIRPDDLSMSNLVVTSSN